MARPTVSMTLDLLGCIKAASVTLPVYRDGLGNAIRNIMDFDPHAYALYYCFNWPPSGKWMLKCGDHIRTATQYIPPAALDALDPVSGLPYGHDNSEGTK